MDDAGIPQRLVLAAAAVFAALGVAAALLVVADGARSGEPAPELLPDLVVQKPNELYIKGNKVPRLRVSNIVANKGAGPLEIAPGDSSNACNIPGKPVGRYTLQNVYSDSADAGSPGFFWRDHDDAYAQTTAGCSRYHAKHDHWHFDNFARYSLYREKNGKARYVGGSRKVSFCVLDTGRPYPELPGSPADGYYPQDPESPKFPTCSSSSIDGLSVGWEDTYGASLPGQGIRIDGLRRGHYCLVLEVDPPAAEGDPQGALAETSDANNSRAVRLRMRPKQAFVKRLSSSSCRFWKP